MPLFSPKNDASADLGPLRILVIDDQWVVRTSLRNALDKLDFPFVVIDAETGEEALSIMRSVPISIIFCDIHLPGISGPEAMARAFADRVNRPFMVLMSAQGSEAARDIGRHMGVYEFLQKPFRPRQVLAAISACRRMQQPIEVLLVDDSSVARGLMTRILARSQFQIKLTQAGSGDHALALAKARQLEVVFLDLNMPGISGLETAALLLQTNPRLQIVIVSTEQQAEIAHTAQFAGAFAFLKKPFDEKDVDAVLHSAFDMARPSLARGTHAVFAQAQGTPKGRGPGVASSTSWRSPPAA